MLSEVDKERYNGVILALLWNILYNEINYDGVVLVLLYDII